MEEISMDTKITKNGYLKVDLGPDTYLTFSGEDNPIQYVMVATKMDKNKYEKRMIAPTLYLKNIPASVQRKVGKENLKKIKNVVKKYLNKSGYLPKENLKSLQDDLNKIEL
jgi:hypothetical protein